MLFEKFVSALDEHDPFIAALLDVLVKVRLDPSIGSQCITH